MPKYEDFTLRFSPMSRSRFAVLAESPLHETCSGYFDIPPTFLETSSSRHLSRTPKTREVELEKPRVDPDLTQAGHLEFDALFQGEVGDLFKRSHEPNRRLRLKLVFPENVDSESIARLHELPWERLSYKRHLGLTNLYSIVRQFDGVAPACLTRSKQLRILVLCSNPTNQASLNLEKEGDILKAIPPKKAHVVFLKDISRSAFFEAMEEHFHIVHFMGHSGWSNEQPALYFKNERGEAEAVYGTQLAEDLQALPKEKRPLLFLLNSCRGGEVRSQRTGLTGLANELVRAAVPAVIAMSGPIRDEAALAFCRKFYRCLAKNHSLDEAVLKGRLAIKHEQEVASDWFRPQLFSKLDGDLLDRPIRKSRLLCGFTGLVVLFLACLSLFFYFEMDLPIKGTKLLKPTKNGHARTQGVSKPAPSKLMPAKGSSSTQTNLGHHENTSQEKSLPKVIINEIHADPDRTVGDANGDGVVSSTQDEFIELLNTSLVAQDISGYTLSDTTGPRFTFPANTIIPPREAVVVFGGGKPKGNFGNAMANGLVFITDSFGLNNSGDTVTLSNASKTVQSVTYGSKGGKNQSLTRSRDGTNSPLVKHTTTNGARVYSPGVRTNGRPFTVASGAILLSEVMYDPAHADEGAEWIELYNASPWAIDLSELSIGAGGTNYTANLIQLSGSIEPGKTFVLGGPKSSANNANPKFDFVYKFTPNIQNSSSSRADGLALFNLKAEFVKATTVPIDTVIYGDFNLSNLVDETGRPGVPDIADAPSGSSIERHTLKNWRVQANPNPNHSLLALAAPPSLNLKSCGSEKVILTEVFYDYRGLDDGFEWVELYNSSSKAVDLACMSLGFGGKNYTVFKVQLFGTLPPNSTFVVGGPKADLGNGNPSFDQAINFSLDLQNSGLLADGVALFNVPADNVTVMSIPIDVVLFGAKNGNGLMDETGAVGTPDVSDAPAGSSIERIDLAGTWVIQSLPNPNQTRL